MTSPTTEARALRAVIIRHRPQVQDVLDRYGARNPRLFGSVARGDATAASDLDVLVDLDPTGGNPLMRLAGIAEELTALLGVRVDVVAEPLLREPVAATARACLVPL
ncbi:nucleotidyltransferase family protein [Protofrankia coriariae]|uniref:Nucleotidyltransferase n=1 Tax=Protofrankia coriariae TaxID=1562887 RepID=A0ABR5F1T2_9ACTN|nr:nucleotidyltransferase domain-containing protein [Protofrankia coriariae]KLL10647.1 nucleotidyltransferase [Protofrankia coriariae]